MKNLILTLLFLATIPSLGQDHNHTFGRKISFPNVPGYITVKCDFHIHTVFSDGSVWPDIRVMEAEKDGLDVISLTEHLEYQPHKEDIPHPNRNRSYDLATKLAANKNLMVVRGSEITRKIPPGHNNAIFIEDANKLLLDDAYEVFKEANHQGAFTFWNHPAWLSQRPDGIVRSEGLQNRLIDEKLLHGIEVVNGQMYSDEALQLALDKNLTIMGTSDVHGLIDFDYAPEHGGHRPITLVLAKEKTEASIKEALFAGRTVVWYKNMLVGKEENVAPLILASLSFVDANYRTEQQVMHVTIKNSSDTEYLLKNKSGYTFHGDADVITIPRQSHLKIQVKTLKQLSQVDLKFEVLNAVIAPEKHPDVLFSITPSR